MKKLKKSVLLILTLLLCLTNFTTVYADNEETTAESLYNATYEFVIDDDSDLPNEVSALLPSTLTDLHSGDVVAPETINDVETDDYVYQFKKWSPSSKAIADGDIHFIGIWSRTEKVKEETIENNNQVLEDNQSENTQTESNANDSVNKNEDELIENNTQETEKPNVSQLEQVNGQNDSTKKKIRVEYKFYEALSVVTPGNLPDEVMALLPASYEIDEDGNQSPVEITTTQVGEFTWQGWNPYHDEEGNVTYFGIWMSPNSKWVKPNSGRPLLRVSSSATFAYSGYWNVPNSIGYAGTGRFTLNGEVAFCIEPDIHMDNSYIGATYSKGGSLGNGVARIIAMGTKNGVSEGSIQAAVWNYIKGTSAGGDECQPDYWAYDGDGWNYSVDTYSSGSRQGLATNPSWSPARTPHGFAKVKKVAASTTFNYLTNCPNNYSLAGAVYGVYRDAACTNQVTTLTTDASGNTPKTGELSPGTYYVKELTASPGFKLDSTIYTVSIPDSDTPVTVTSTETPMNDPISVNLYKLNRRDLTNVLHLNEAEFTLKYYDSQSDNPTSLSPKYEWTFSTIYNSSGVAVCNFKPEHLVSGPDPNTLGLVSSFGFFLPLGTFTIEETKAPTLFARDENIYIGHIVNNNGNAIETVDHYIDASGNLNELTDGNGSWIDVDNEDLSQNEELQTVNIVIQKLDADSNTNILPEHVISTTTLEGGVFHIWRTGEYQTDSSNNVSLVDIDPIDYGTITTDATGRAELKYEPGTTDGLLPGKFLIKEEKAPAGYTVNTNEFTINALIREVNTANFEYSIDIADKITRITVSKIDSEGEYLDSNAECTIQLKDPDGNVVYSFVPDGMPHIIRGLTTGINYTLHELEVAPIYRLAADKTVNVTNSNMYYYSMVDQIVSISTSARFSNEGKKTWDNQSNKNYVADGVAHIIDTVSYQSLYENQEYVLVGKLVDATTNQELQTVEKQFTPTRRVGNVDVEFDQQLDNLDNHDIAVVVSLYHVVDGNRVFILTHNEDLNDAEETIHVDPLYRADFILNKVDADDDSIKLDGVEFSILTLREKRDGTLERSQATYTTDSNGQIIFEDCKEDTQFMVLETKEYDETYYKWPDAFTYELGHDASLDVIEKTLVNHKIKIHTSAKFDETTKFEYETSNDKTYVADGFATIIDTVSYEWLYPNKEYMLVGTLIDKGPNNSPFDETNAVELMSVEKTFIPSEINGTTTVEFKFNLDGYDNHDFVVYEELKLVDSKTETPVVDDEGEPVLDKNGEQIIDISYTAHKVAEHKEFDDADQTVSVAELYHAAMALYKIGNNNKEIKLDGAYFSVSTNRTKRDGTLVEENLGDYVTGGILVERDEAFKAYIYSDEEMTEQVREIDSSFNNSLSKHAVCVTDLPEAEYYVLVDGESEPTKYLVEKGTIVILNQPENTQITFKEIIAPSGYYLDGTPYVTDVGHDYSLTRVENFRSNSLIIIPSIIPKTGYEE